MGCVPVGSHGCLGATQFLSLLIVELFCVIDKLQVWHSEEGRGQLSMNGGALGHKAHLDSSIETILCSGRCVLED